MTVTEAEFKADFDKYLGLASKEDIFITLRRAADCKGCKSSRVRG